MSGQPDVLYGAVSWSHLSHSESNHSWSEMNSKPPSVLCSSAGTLRSVVWLG